MEDREGAEDEPDSVLIEMKAEDDDGDIGQGVHIISFEASFNTDGEASVVNLNESVMSGGTDPARFGHDRFTLRSR